MMAEMVPIGIALFGSFRSPDIAIPAVKPVTAGKNMANTVSKGTLSVGDVFTAISFGEIELPKNTRFMEYIQFVRNGISRDLGEITNKYNKITFIEYYDIEKSK